MSEKNKDKNAPIVYWLAENITAVVSRFYRALTEVQIIYWTWKLNISIQPFVQL